MTESNSRIADGGLGKRRSSLSSPESGSGIDAFLKRLDDVDLSKKTSDEEPAQLNGDTKAAPLQSISTNRRIAKLLAVLIILALLYDVAKSPPDKRLIGSHRIHDLIHDFLFWVKEHPGTGAAAFVFVYALCVVLLLPGTVSYGELFLCLFYCNWLTM